MLSLFLYRYRSLAADVHKDYIQIGTKSNVTVNDMQQNGNDRIIEIISNKHHVR